MKKLSVVCAVALCAVLSSAFGAAKYQIPITVSGYSGAETLENFPVLVRLAERNAEAGTGISGFDYAQCAADGRDVSFTLEDGTVLAREIDTWNPDGESLVWVRVPALSNGLKIICTYGDASVTAQPASQTDGSVWTPSGYVGVWHMNNVNPTDSCGNYHGTGTSVTEAAGALGTALDFSGNNGQAVALPVIDRASLLSGCTIESWQTVRNGGLKAVFNVKDFLSVRQNGGSIEITTPGVKDYGAVAIGAPFNEWYHLTVSFVQNTANNGVVIYKNGESQKSMTTTNVKQESGTAEAWIGNSQWGGQVMNGLIDEIRLSSVIRSADWVNAAYDTSAAGTDFLRYGDANIAADNTSVRVVGSPENYGVSTPAYGVTTGYGASDPIDFKMEQNRVTLADGGQAVLVGWELYSVDLESGEGTLQKSYQAGSGDALNAYAHTFNGFAEFRWLWSVRYAAHVEMPVVVDLTDTEIKVSVTVSGLGFNSDSAVLKLTYGAQEDQLTSETEGQQVTAQEGKYVFTLPRPAAGSALYAKALLTPSGDAQIESEAVSFKLRTDALCLKPLAEGETRAAINGYSWATAFVDPVEAMRTAEAQGVPLYVAAGVYTVTNHTYVASKDIALYGGFPGISDDETLTDRDPARYESVLSGDVGQNDVWTHYLPDGYSAKKDTTAGYSDIKIIQNGKLVRPPAYTEEFDVYVNVIGDGNAKYLLQSNKSLVMDGITMFGFKHNELYRGPLMPRGEGGIITNCIFIGNYPQYGTILGGGTETKIVDCQFIYTASSGRAAALTPQGGGNNMYVDNCRFESLFRNSDGGAGLVFNTWGGDLKYVRRSVITRSHLAQNTKYNGNYGGDGNFFGSEGGSLGEVSDCVISNCFTAYAGNTCLNFVSPGGSAGIPFVRTYFVNNRSRVKPVDGKNYSMFGRQGSSSGYFSFVDCTFSGNVIEAIDVAATKGSYLLSITGNYDERQDMSFMNCVFDDNKAIAKAVEGVTPILCRGVATAAYVPDAKNQVGIANTVFRSTEEDGAYDFVQYGTAHAQPINIVNTIFVGKNDTLHKAIRADKPELIKLYSCQVQNNVEVPEGIATATDYEYDRVPLVKEVLNETTGLYTYRRDAKTPNYDKGCDIATNKFGKTASDYISWAFRTREAEAAWQSLTPSSSALNGNKHGESPACDALGAVQTFGAFSRGPTKALTEKAATGASLVLRREPFAAGSFNYDSVQSAAKGTAITPVTATAVDSTVAAFEGWMRADERTHSSNAKLEGSFTDDITVLTAKYAAPTVSITFDLDGMGTFTENDKDTITIEYPIYGAIPAPPPFTVNEGYYLVDFVYPDVAPGENATYKAHIITKDARIFCVVPESEAPTGVQDGKSWATAYTDIQAAIYEAGLYKGEVWFKKGTYKFPNVVYVKANVILRGGFDGTEALSAENASLADPEKNKTIFSGDTNDDGYWKGCTPSSLEESPIWLDGVYQSPNPDGLLERWNPDGNNSENAKIAFKLYDSTNAGNIGFDGITFTLFKQSPIYFSAASRGDVTVTRCQFLANAMEGNEYGALRLYNVSLVMNDSLFNGNGKGPWLQSSSSANASYSYVTNCVFSNNSSSQWNYQAAFQVRDNSTYAEIVSSYFYRNDSTSDNNYSGMAVAAVNANTRLIDCTFEDNRGSNMSYGTVSLKNGTHKIIRCKFISNKLSAVTAELRHSSAAIRTETATAVIEKCYFSGNEVEIIDTAKAGDRLMSSAVSAVGGTVTLLNSTLENNRVTNLSTLIDTGATISHNTDNTSLSIIGTLITDSVFAAGEGCAMPVELKDSSNRPFALVNSILNNTSDSYIPVKLTHTDGKAHLYGSMISKLDAAVMPSVENGSTVTNVVSVTSEISSLKENDDGTLARRPLGAMQYVKLSFPVYHVASGNNDYFYIRQETTPNTPWFRLGEYVMKSDKDSGLSADSKPIGDAFGNPRKKRLAIPGPLQASDPATVIRIR